MPYMVAQQLAEGGVAGIVVRRDGVRLFTGEGVFRFQGDRRALQTDHLIPELIQDNRRENIWMFIDGSEFNSDSTFPWNIVEFELLFPVYIVSLGQHKYERRGREMTTLVVNPWTDEELFEGLPLQLRYFSASQDQQNRLRQALPHAIDVFRSLPRDVYRAVSNPDYEHRLLETLDTISSTKRLVDAVCNVDTSGSAVSPTSSVRNSSTASAPRPNPACSLAGYSKWLPSGSSPEAHRSEPCPPP
ncbi:hypothetical protein BV25DRAFT_1831219 [Artomyces pyxidatus]|uniref:Uncharacterized protein n=1 Tax=Artomyces pyxidatus TaxID=48021 RepID=A0ACB8SLS3_9AGAM|nr:hypothetical protein BV25DRAFT_1831219 [Artomyces pyxidatus]